MLRLPCPCTGNPSPPPEWRITSNLNKATQHMRLIWSGVETVGLRIRHYRHPRGQLGEKVHFDCGFP